MYKKIYIVVASIDFLCIEDFIDEFLKNSAEDIKSFCDDNYDRGDCDLAIYPLDEFIVRFNENEINSETTYIRKIEF